MRQSISSIPLKIFSHLEVQKFICKHYHWLIPLLVVAIIAPFTPKLDLAISHFFYEVETQTFSGHYLLEFMYIFGELPALFTGGVAGCIVALSFFSSFFKKWRNGALTLLLTFVIGCGILTNAVFKEHWGRARPKQIVQFGGPGQYSPFYIPDFSSSGIFKSFPSGHCATGFFFFSLWKVGRREKNKFLENVGIVLTLGLGSLLTLSRIGQGGHFFSDAMIAALIMWYTSLAMERLIYERSH